ncbi:MAG TPA: LarC family nickel insertion protein, partial [Blastocatellia bacterium]
AAIVTTLCEEFGSLPEIEIIGAGYGAGSRDPKGFPNALRLVFGEVANGQRAAKDDQRVFVIETNIDDMSPQAYGFVLERAFALGALDVFMIAAQMKKTRPGVLLTVLCEPERLDSIMQMLLAETTTLGVRYHEAKRRVLDRSIETVETEYGRVRIKVARDGARTLHFQAEYDDCARLAEQSSVPLLEVQAAAGAAYRDLLKKKEEAARTNGERKEER